MTTKRSCHIYFRYEMVHTLASWYFEKIELFSLSSLHFIHLINLIYLYKISQLICILRTSINTFRTSIGTFRTSCTTSYLMGVQLCVGVEYRAASSASNNGLPAINTGLIWTTYVGVLRPFIMSIIGWMAFCWREARRTGSSCVFDLHIWVTMVC